MKILHSYCLNYNIGDYALGIGLKNLLRAHLDVDFIGNTNIQGRVFNEYYINEVVNKRYDLLVIGGGGIIHGSHWPNGWFWLIDKELIQTIKIPFIVYGVGYNYWEEEKIPSRGVAHLKETVKYAKHFSVRNDGSAERIAKDIGMSFEVVPDPGFHINLNTSYNKIYDVPYILIQLANDKPIARFGNLENRQKFVTKFKRVVTILSKKYKVVFAPHVYEDVAISKEIADGINNTEVWDFSYYAFDHTNIAVGVYENAEFVISMRGHGQIVPIAFHTPVIALENHPKHRGLMQELNLLDYNVNIHNEDFDQILEQKIKLIESNLDELKSSYKNINQKLILESKKAWTNIKSYLL